MANVAQASTALWTSKSIKQQQGVLCPQQRFYHFRFSRVARISFLPSDQGKSRPRSTQLVSRVTEVAVDGALATAVVAPELELKPQEDASEENPDRVRISSILSDVSNLLTLVDSRDIVELEMKHPDFELILRKKEALEPRTTEPSAQNFAQSTYPLYAQLPPAAPAPAPAPVPPPENKPALSSAPAAPAALPASSMPRILSPMAGTFYKCPAPGEPPFVKVGDRVTKGQVICIVEAMKLMNEIEADQSGTIVEILAEDGKPVAVDTPLYAIKP